MTEFLTPIYLCENNSGSEDWSDLEKEREYTHIYIESLCLFLFGKHLH